LSSLDKQEQIEFELREQGLEVNGSDVDFGIPGFTSPSISKSGQERLEQVKLQQYIDEQQAKPEVRRKLYDRATANANSSGSGSSSQPNRDPFAPVPQRAPVSRFPTDRDGTPKYQPAGDYFHPGYDLDFPDRFPPFQPLHRGGTNPALDYKSPTAEDFIQPPTADPFAPRNPLGIAPLPRSAVNGNLPDGFVPVAPTDRPSEPGSVSNKLYRVTLNVVINGNTQNGGVLEIPGPISQGRNDRTDPDGSITYIHGYFGGNPSAFYTALTSGSPNNSIQTVSIIPSNPNDPDPVIRGTPQPAPQIPVDPDTGRANLPEFTPTPSLREPNSPQLTPSPSPRNSPSGSPSAVPNPTTSPNLNPGAPFALPDFPEMPSFFNPTAPDSPSSPLSNPTIPFNNPATPASKGNPSTKLNQPSDGSFTGVTINGDRVDAPNIVNTRAREPVRAPTFDPGTNVTINGEPIPNKDSLKVPSDVTTPNGNVSTPATSEREQTKTQPKPEETTQPRQTCDDPCVQGLHDKLDGQSLTSIEVNVFDKCNVEKSEAVYKKQTFKVPQSLAATLTVMLNDLAVLQGKDCSGGGEAIASVPEWWQARRGSDIPQLAIIFAEQFSSGKLGKSRWTLCIPHYNRPKGAKPSIPTYNKGNWFGTLKLTDGSKLGVNAASSSECKRILNRLKIHIPVEFRTKKGKAIKPRIVEDPTADFKECKVTPVRADYYSKGQSNMKPDWSVNLRSK
jgi:hypothetical protein